MLQKFYEFNCNFAVTLLRIISFCLTSRLRDLCKMFLRETQNMLFSLLLSLDEYKLEK